MWQRPTVFVVSPPASRQNVCALQQASVGHNACAARTIIATVDVSTASFLAPMLQLPALQMPGSTAVHAVPGVTACVSRFEE